MATIQELMQASRAALAAKTAAQASAVGVKTDIALAAEAAAGGAGEGATATTQAAVAGAGTAAGEQGGAAAGAGAQGSAEAAAVGASAAAAAVAAPDLTALVTKVTDLSIANVKLEAERDSYLASCAALIAIASDSLDRMNIALGGGKIDVANMTPETLVAQHATVAAQFTSKFPVGGVAAVNHDADTTQEAQARERESLAMHHLRVAAAAGGNAAKK